MVGQQSMEVNKEAQDYLKQFSVQKTRPAHSIDSNLESMLDTWTREKNRLKSSTRKTSSSLPKEWEKVPSALGDLAYDSHLEGFADDILRNENDIDEQQDTYMNEEAFLEQLLHQDTLTKTNKPARRRQELKPHKSPKQSKHSHKQQTANTKKQLSMPPEHYMVSPLQVNTGGHVPKHFVAGHHVSNESKQAVLRRGVCQDEEVPNLSPRHQTKIRHPPPEILPQPVDLLPAVDNVAGSGHYNIPQTVNLQPICQKCGWTLTSSTGEVLDLPEILEIIGPKNKMGDYSTHSNQTLLNISTSNNNLKYSPSPGQQHHSPRSRKSSQGSNHSPHHQYHSPQQQHLNSNDSTKLSPRSNINRHLTTSVHCHSRASQTDPNLLNQDLSPFAEVENVSGSSKSNTLNHSNNNRQKVFTKAKPPSGRQVKPDVLGGNVDMINEQAPLVEAAKSGNVDLLQQILTSDPEQSKFHDVQGNNLLHIVSERGHLTCVQYLANVYPNYCEQENKAKFTPAALTVKAGHIEVLDWLLENTTAKEETLPLLNKKSLLHHAAKFGQDGCLRVVLEKMTAIDRNNSCCDSNGNSPAHVAAKHGHLLCLQSLVEYGVDVTKANKYGHSPCYYADFSNHKLCASYLMVVETCLNLAKKLIRLERSMEQLSNSLAKYSDNTADVNLGYDYNADRSSATSSVEDDGTRDEAWQLLCRKFEEASKRLVVFRTQNRAVRPLRPTKLALLALAQTKEETQAALSAMIQVKGTSSTNDLANDIPDGSVSLEVNRSKSVPDLPSSFQKEEETTKLKHFTSTDLPSEKSNIESTFVITGTPTKQKSEVDNTGFELKTGHLDLIGHSSNTFEIQADIHNDNLFNNDHKSATLRLQGSKPVKPPRKEHKRSSSVGDIIDSDISLNKASDDIEYHLRTRILPPSPLIPHRIPTDNQQALPSRPKLPPPRPQVSPPPPPLPPRQHTTNRRFLHRGAEALPPPPGESEQTSDFFEESNGRHDSDVSDLDPQTLQKILDMQEEIMKCDPNHIQDYQGLRIRTPVKLELTHEDFNETYARKPPDDEADFTLPPFRFRRGPPVRLRYGDNMNKSGNNSHTDSLEDIVENEYASEENGIIDEDIISEESDQKPWYEMSEDDENGENNEEFFTLL